MTEKTEEKMEKERVAVASLVKAQANMKEVLERVSTLEHALRVARANISTLKGYIGENVYTYSSGEKPKACRTIADEAMATITKAIGA